MISADDDFIAQEHFRRAAEAATRQSCPGAFPTFHEHQDPDGQVTDVGVFVRAPGATWQDVPLADLRDLHGGTGAALDNFGAMMRAAAVYATDHGGLPGAFPTFFHAGLPSGTVAGIVTLNDQIAEWRDVPHAELGSPSLDSIRDRFAATQDYAVRNGFVGGFPNMFHGVQFFIRPPFERIVCGTVLLKAPMAQVGDVVLQRPL